MIGNRRVVPSMAAAFACSFCGADSVLPGRLGVNSFLDRSEGPGNVTASENSASLPDRTNRGERGSKCDARSHPGENEPCTEDEDSR